MGDPTGLMTLGGSSTSPIIEISTLGCDGSLVVTVLVLVCLPCLPFVLKLALILAFSSGFILESVELAAIQLQEVLMCLISKSLLPVLLVFISVL